MKNLILHPEWDKWLFLTIVLSPILGFGVMYAKTSVQLLNPDGDPGYGILIFALGVIISILGSMLLLEARSARAWVERAKSGGVLKGYASSLFAMSGFLFFSCGPLWMLFNAHQGALMKYVGTPILVLAGAYPLLFRSRFSPWGIPEIEFNEQGIVTPLAFDRDLSMKGGFKRSLKKRVCKIAWADIVDVSWGTSTVVGNAPALEIRTRRITWYRRWRDYLHDTGPLPVDKITDITIPVPGDRIPPDALVMIARERMCTL